MNRRSKHRRKRASSTEPRSVEVLTIGWMLMVVTTLLCEAGSLASHWVSRGAGTLGVLSGLLLFAACVIGLGVLLLTPVVLKSRRLPPPLPITVFALVVAVAPLATMLLQALE
ncbi:MAG: hypothetical protein WD278_08840 [Pirellulales bacterium]